MYKVITVTYKMFQGVTYHYGRHGKYKNIFVAKIALNVASLVLTSVWS